MIPTIEERVTCGAEWLDEASPGWERLVDLGRFSIGSTSGECLLCQVSRLANFSHALAWAEIRGMTLRVNWAFAGEPAGGWRSLDDAWTSLIKERFASGLLSDEATDA